MTIVYAIWSFFTWIFEGLHEFLAWVWEWVWTTGSQYVYLIWQWFLSKMPAGWRNFLEQNPLPDEMWSAMQTVDHLVPWKILLGIIVFTRTVAGTIRLVRWVLGLSFWGFSANG